MQIIAQKAWFLAETYVGTNHIFRLRVLHLPYQSWQFLNAQRLEPAVPRLGPKPCSDHTKGQRTWWSDYLLSKKKRKKKYLAPLEWTWLQLRLISGCKFIMVFPELKIGNTVNQRPGLNTSAIRFSILYVVPQHCQISWKSKQLHNLKPTSEVLKLIFLTWPFDLVFNSTVSISCPVTEKKELQRNICW